MRSVQQLPADIQYELFLMPIKACVWQRVTRDMTLGLHACYSFTEGSGKTLHSHVGRASLLSWTVYSLPWITIQGPHGNPAQPQ